MSDFVEFISLRVSHLHIVVKQNVFCDKQYRYLYQHII